MFTGQLRGTSTCSRFTGYGLCGRLDSSSIMAAARLSRGSVSQVGRDSSRWEEHKARSSSWTKRRKVASGERLADSQTIINRPIPPRPQRRLLHGFSVWVSVCVWVGTGTSQHGLRRKAFGEIMRVRPLASLAVIWPEIQHKAHPMRADDKSGAAAPNIGRQGCLPSVPAGHRARDGVHPRHCAPRPQCLGTVRSSRNGTRLRA